MVHRLVRLVDGLKAHIVKPGDPLRLDLAGQMIEALTTLSDEAANGGEVFCALYEFQDPEVIDHLAKLKDKANVILSNMPGTADGEKTNDTYAGQRQQIRDAGANVIDRFMPSSHIGHNKFQVLDKGGPQAVSIRLHQLDLERVVRANEQLYHSPLAGACGGL